MRNYPNTILLALIVLVVLIIGYAQIDNYRECSANGGDYVMGMVGYTCVGEDK